MKAWLALARQYATLLMVAGAVLVVAGFAYQQRKIGERTAMLKTTNERLDSLAKVLKADEEARVEATARARRDSVAVIAARRETARAVARSQEAAATAAAARAEALALVANAEATVPQLKEEIVRLAASGEAAEQAFTAERATWESEREKSGRALLSLRGEIETWKNENADLRTTNDGLKDKVQILEKGKPGVMTKYVLPAVTFGAGWLAKR